MFTQEQAAQVKQFVAKHTGKQVTAKQLKRIYELDYAAYEDMADEVGSYAEYFGDIFGDAWGEEAFLDTIEEALAA